MAGRTAASEDTPLLLPSSIRETTLSTCCHGDCDDDGGGDQFNAAKDFDDNKVWSIPWALLLGHHRTWLSLTTSTVTVGTVLVGLLAALLVMVSCPTAATLPDPTAGGAASSHDHWTRDVTFVPTVLSVVHAETRDLLHALNHPLYDAWEEHAVWKSSTKQNARKQQNPDVNQTMSTLLSSSPKNGLSQLVQPRPQLSVDRTVFDRVDQSLTLRWTTATVGSNNTNNSSASRTLPSEEDFLVLTCSLDVTDSSANNAERGSTDGWDDPAAQVLEVATIAQARATARANLQYKAAASRQRQDRHDRSSAESSNDVGSEDQWYFEQFPILRRRTCQFWLLQKQPSCQQQRQQRGSDCINGGVNGSSFTDAVARTALLGFPILASSPPLIFTDSYLTSPTAIHMAMTGNPTEMHVSFISGVSSSSSRQGRSNGRPVIAYRELSSDSEDDYDSDYDDENWDKAGRVSGDPDDSSEEDPNDNITVSSWTLSYGETDTYRATDLCDAPANVTAMGKFQPPGLLHQILVTQLKPDTRYQYRVGYETLIDNDDENEDVMNSKRQQHERGHGRLAVDDKDDSDEEKDSRTTKAKTPTTWSNMYSFTTPLPLGSRKPFSYLAYGDQGCPAKGWSYGGLWVADMVALEIEGVSKRSGKGTSKLPPIRAIHHIGDLSYANGAAHVWDAWMNMIQPATARVPLMIGIGNHEYGYLHGGVDKDPSRDPNATQNIDHSYAPEWQGDNGSSQGECGVPAAKRFTMPSQYRGRPSNGVFWYSFDHGLVHTAMISSEHDLSPGSRQYQWLQQDFEATDRYRTPWLVLQIHRPLYYHPDDSPKSSSSRGIRQRIEDLLFAYKVDLVLSGHEHNYMRSCDGLYRSRCYNSRASSSESDRSYQGPMHITIGSTGGQIDKGNHPAAGWTDRFITDEYGYGRLTVWNATTMHVGYISAASSAQNMHPSSWNPQQQGRLLDEVSIFRDR